MISIRGERTYEFRGLSTDKKPVNDYIDNGSIFIEMDTSIIYTFDKKNKKWLVLEWNDAVSQEEFNEFKEEVGDEIEDLRDLIATDVKEIVGSYEELEIYVQEHLDTLKVNDKIEVLVDETEEGTNTVYRYLGNGQVELIGRLGPYYTKSEVDEKFALKADDTTPVVPKPDPEDPSIVVPTNDELAFTVSQKVIDPETGEESYQSLALTLDDLRQRILASTDTDNVEFDNAQIGQFLYEEIEDVESLATWADINNQNAWEAEYANPDSALRKYYTWSDDANKPYKEDLWNYVENRAARLSDARKVDGEYVYDENGNYIYDNCERCWLGAINAPGASYPWAVVELPIPFYGTIKFQYKNEEPVYPWGEGFRTFGRGFGVASIPDELNKPELKINAAGEATVPLLEGDLVITVIEGGE